jgi:hypothetical protein
MYFHFLVSIVTEHADNRTHVLYHGLQQQNTSRFVKERRKFTMFMQLKHISRWTPLALYCLMLAVLLTACGGTTPTHAAPPNTTATPMPTSASMTSIAGNGFTMNYPQGWQIGRSGAHLITVTNSQGTESFAITVVPSPKSAISADSLVNSAAKAQTAVLKDAQKISVPPTVMVGGASWNQESVSGTQRLHAANTVVQSVVLATVHPGNTPTSKAYTIVYRAPQTTFAQANTSYFQPMLQSIKFQP